MATMNVGEAISPTIAHTARLLFKPFALRKWLALGFVALLAAMGDGGFRFNFGANSDANGPAIGAWIEHHVAWIIVVSVVLSAIGLVLMWVGSVMKFVYLNQITRDPYAIREPFHRFRRLGTSLFLWRLAFIFVVVLVAAVVIALPIAALQLNRMTQDGSAMIVLGIWCILFGLAILITAAVVDIFARDFVATAMFVRGVKVLEGWRTALPLLRENRKQYALYVLMLIAIALVTGFASSFILLALLIPFALAAAPFALVGYWIYNAGGHAWSSGLIAYAATFGMILLAVLSFAMTCASQPLFVFRRTYALAVVGQADPGLATLPPDQPLQRPYQPPEQEI